MPFYQSENCSDVILFPGVAMHNLADTYNGLGRHEDAVVLQEKVLELRRRVLPPNHEDIGSAFNVICL